MRISKPAFALLFVLLFATTASWGQLTGKSTKTNSPYDSRLLIEEPDPALSKSSFKPSAQVQGLKGKDGVVYWLSADKKSITAYKGETTLWASTLASALPKEAVGPLTIKSMAWCDNALFFSIGESAYVELDRQTGKVNQAGTD